MELNSVFRKEIWCLGQVLLVGVDIWRSILENQPKKYEKVINGIKFGTFKIS